MPLPKPRPGEKRDAFMGRCMAALHGEDRPHDQKVAMCLRTFDDAHKGRLRGPRRHREE